MHTFSAEEHDYLVPSVVKRRTFTRLEAGNDCYSARSSLGDKPVLTIMSSPSILKRVRSSLRDKPVLTIMFSPSILKRNAEQQVSLTCRARDYSLSIGTHDVCEPRTLVDE